MPGSIARKLKIREDDTICVIHPPADYAATLGELPAGARITTTTGKCQQIHWFVRHKKEMEKDLERVLAMLQAGVTAWVFYPKGTSGMQTDLTRDKGWESLMQQDVQWLALVSFDTTWSAFAIRRKSDVAAKRQAKKESSPIYEFIDPEKKTVRVPDDLADALKKHKKEQAYFDGLAYSHRKEYVEWIVSAKKEETRKRRIGSMIEMLGRQLKNPSAR